MEQRPQENEEAKKKFLEEQKNIAKETSKEIPDIQKVMKVEVLDL